MSFKCILIVYICLIFNDVLTQNIYPGEEKQHHKLSVVLFFAKCTNNIPEKGSGLKILDIHEMARVKHSVPTPRYSQLTINNIMLRNTPNCKELLKDGIASLVHYCQNALGMKTAVASVSNQEITNDISNEEPDVPPDIKEDQASVGHDEKTHLAKVRVVNMRDIITSPEHREVFKIRMKRHQSNEANEKPVEIVDVPLGKEKKPPWDVLDIMAHIRFSFFGKLFENGAKKKLTDEENHIAGNEISQSKDPGLFEIVKSTLTSLQETPDQAFLMVIFGAHIEEIENNQSPLIQSVKHVIESTDPESTLIVLTCSCPHHEENQQNHESNESQAGQENNGRHENYEHHDHQEHHENNEHHDHQEHYENKEHHDHQEHHEYNEHHDHHEHHENPDHHEHPEIPEYHNIHNCHHENPEHSINRNHEYPGHHHNQQDVVEIREDPRIPPGVEEDENIPVFAKGPKSDILSQCTELYDIPLTIKTILEESSPNFGERVDMPQQERHKRSLFAGIRSNLRGGVDKITYKFQSVIFYLCTSILFII